MLARIVLNSVDQGGLEFWPGLFVSNRTLGRKTRGKRRNEEGKKRKGAEVLMQSCRLSGLLVIPHTLIHLTDTVL